MATVNTYNNYTILKNKKNSSTVNHLADTFIQSDFIEAIKTNKRATTCKCYDKSWLA